MSKRTRKHPDDRREEILVAAMKIAREVGYTNVTREAIAAEVEVGPPLISSYYGTMPQLKRAIMRRAVQIEDAQIVAQGLVMRDAHAIKAPDALKAAAANKLGTM